MSIFKQSKNKSSVNDVINNTDKNIVITERPRICCIDLDEETITALQKSGANIYSGTLGSKIRVPNHKHRSSHQILLHYDFPPNLHEFDIIIIDLNNFKTIEYKAEEHIRDTHTGKSSLSLLSSYPETLFDPRPLSSLILSNQLRKISNRKYLVVAFTSESYDIEYDSVIISEGDYERQVIQKQNIYSFWGYVPTAEPKYGKEITICKMRIDMQSLLEKYKKDTTYNQTFNHPTIWANGNSTLDSRYFPLVTNLNGDIVSYLEGNEFENLIVLPQIKDKSNFILEFLSKVAPSIFPELFPYSTTFNWKEQAEYWLPKHSDLLDDRAKIEAEYEKKIQENQKKIEDNLKRHLFLQDILTETGNKLVTALIKYLKWLGFDNVKDFDEIKSNPSILEEDIQIVLSNGLLVIECKGIGGTSSDSDCNQISKIKHRRCKERNQFDVFALYVVNHQRYLPPLKRQIPPFSEHQIQDAKNDERGLLSTWQLFNLYFEISEGLISKEEARKSILEFGLVQFRPKDLCFVSETTEIFNEGRVCIVNIDNVTISIEDELFIEKNGKFSKVKLPLTTNLSNSGDVQVLNIISLMIF
jgi:hypothetical protein